jgi:(S)-ureidoglycine aminohydrolase
MRALNQLVSSRTFLGQRSALFPLEGYPKSRLPGFPQASSVRVLASPRMGAEFVQYLIEMPPSTEGTFAAEPGVEVFFYVTVGEGDVVADTGLNHRITPGSFGLVKPGGAVTFQARSTIELMIFRKRYEPAAGIDPTPGYYGSVAEVPKVPWNGNPGSLLQTLIPDDLQYDIAVNIFTFAPGHGLPIIETHVMEHGAMILQGKGLYYLEDRWMEVEKDDFIYMGPYCPQSFYATGTEPAMYIYYKNVNREIPL